MRIIKNTFSALVLLAVCQLSLAETFTFETVMPGHSNANSYYPHLDLHAIDKIKVWKNLDNMSGELVLDKVEIRFPNANNLVASNFKKTDLSSTIYRATVNGAWVYKQLIVEVDDSSNFINIRVFVSEGQNSMNNAMTMPGLMLLETSGELVSTTPKQLADITKIKIDGKYATLKLFKRYQLENRFLPTPHPEGFEIAVDWQGHGQASYVINHSLSQSEIYRFKAVSMTIDPVPGDIPVLDSGVRVTITDGMNKQEIGFIPLREILQSLITDSNNP